MRVLITGGAGYIGGITAKILKQQGFQPLIYDRKNGQDINNTAKLIQILKQKHIDAVMHFAAYISMGESMIKPQKYFQNNFLGSQSLLEAMIAAKVNKLVFSSTAGVYGNPQHLPLNENHPKNPENPYGQSKLMTEQLLNFYDRTAGIKSISLRYFNAAGASLDGKIGENHQPETHLIPNIISALLKKQIFHLNGSDYPTPDGTCIRDYVHVLDLAAAHILALKALITGHQTAAFNVGAGKGYSNLEVIKMVEKISGQKLMLKSGPRRPGDANQLIADISKIKQQLGFKPQYSDLKTIITTAWNWHKSQVKI